MAVKQIDEGSSIQLFLTSKIKPHETRAIKIQKNFIMNYTMYINILYIVSVFSRISNLSKDDDK